MKKILVVEANAKHGKSIRTQLEKHGFQVTVRSTPNQARDEFYSNRPDAWVVDLNVSATKFLEFYRWLKDSPETSGIPGVFISGKAEQGMTQQLHTQFSEAILTKPLDISQLVNRLNTLVNPGNSQQPNGQPQPVSFLSSLPGKLIGSTVIRKEIARGGMGAVFLGYQEALARQVAVKVLLPGMLEDPTAIERFKREARAAAQLKNPHIVQVFDFGPLPNHGFYITMEYLPGQTIEYYLKRNGRFPIEKAVSTINQTARGLLAAHEAQLIHRDIKPSNLVMSNTGHVTITDFGLVRPQKKIQQTQTGMVVGTPHYLAPEQASGTPLDLRTDIYSLGIVFYQLVTGEVPFTAATPMQLLMKHLNEPLPDPRQKLPDIPAKLAAIIQRMTSKDPDSRYLSCRELLWELEAFSNAPGQTVSSPPSGDPADSPFTVGTSTGPLEEIQMETSFNDGFQQLKVHFPTLFSREKLKGVMTLSESGAMLNRRGMFPEEWKEPLFVLHESTKEINTALQLGEWQFKIIETPGEIVAQFPMGDRMGTMRFSQTDSQGGASAVLKGQSSVFRKIDGNQKEDPLLSIAAVNGVRDTMLFGPGGKLIHHRLKNRDREAVYAQRFPPAARIIQSLSFEISAIDLWFEKGRVLMWNLGGNLLLVTGSREVSRPFLSIFISSHIDALLYAAQDKPAPGKAPRAAASITEVLPVEHPVSPEMMGKIQHQLALFIGPIAKVVMSKTAKSMGYSARQFPQQELPGLVKNLAKKVLPDKKNEFTEQIQDLLYEAGSK